MIRKTIIDNKFVYLDSPANHPCDLIIKGKRTLNGYVMVYSPNHPISFETKDMVYEHRIVMEQHLGRFLTEDEVVHHIDHNRQNNLIENLQLTDKNSHGVLHGDEKRRIIGNCVMCNKESELLNEKFCRICYHKQAECYKQRGVCKICGKNNILKSKKSMICRCCYNNKKHLR